MPKGEDNLPQNIRGGALDDGVEPEGRSRPGLTLEDLVVSAD